jgi:hypothetical protein
MKIKVKETSPESMYLGVSKNRWSSKEAPPIISHSVVESEIDSKLLKEAHLDHDQIQKMLEAAST